MSTLALYYSTLALWLVGLVAALTGAFDPLATAGLFVGAVALSIYNRFGIGCWKCRKRLGFMLTLGGLGVGFPGRYCTSCGADLAAKHPH